MVLPFLEQLRVPLLLSRNSPQGQDPGSPNSAPSLHFSFKLVLCWTDSRNKRGHQLSLGLTLSPQRHTGECHPANSPQREELLGL